MTDLRKGCLAKLGKHLFPAHTIDGQRHQTQAYSTRCITGDRETKASGTGDREIVELDL